MAAVASVIRNRLAAGGYGKTPTDIVRAPNQFEPWNTSTSLYFPDLRWSQPELQDALAAFFHYILTGAWPPSNPVFK